MNTENTTTSNITYIRQGKPAKQVDNTEILEAAKEDIQKLLSAKNLHFLFGAGTSVPAIPVMSELQKQFETNLKLNVKHNKEGPCNKLCLYDGIKNQSKQSLNLEEILAVLNAKIFSDSYIKPCDNKTEELKLSSLARNLAKDIRDCLLSEVRRPFMKSPRDRSDDDERETLENYIKFYQKTALRHKDLERINVFTTNYDLFNEEALDSQDINFNSGFRGGLYRLFNPARFHFTMSKKLDPAIEQYEPVDDMVHLYKLHGSINWIKDNHGKRSTPSDASDSKNKSYFPQIEELIPFPPNKSDETDNVMIYPTPLKDGETLGSPYSDLMREFKAKLLLPHSTLMVIGYGFGDDHINRIIYQALSVNTSLSIFVFGSEAGALASTSSTSEKPDKQNGEKKNKHPAINSRFYCLHGTIKSDESSNDEHTNSSNLFPPGVVNHFNYIVDELLPEPDEDKAKKVLEDFAELLNSSKKGSR